jgi:PKD repeat protein
MKFRLVIPITVLLSFFSFFSTSYSQADTLFVFASAGEVCVGECVDFFLEPGVDPNQVFEWVISTGEVFPSQGNQGFTYCFFEEGSYEISVNVDSFTVVFPAFVFAFQEPGPDIITISDVFCPANNPDNPPGPNACQKVCANSSVTYELLFSPGGINAVWTVQGADSYEISPDGSQITVDWGGPGQGFLEATTFGFCQGTSSLCVDIIPDPTAELSTIPAAVSDVVTICEGQTVYFENLSSGADTYEWDFGLLGTSDETTPELTFPDAGTYDIALIARNACFCSDTTFVTIEVLDSEAPVLDCAGTVCPGETVTYTTSVSCGNYDWSITGSGTVVAGGGPADDFITVEWTDGPEGYIRLEVSGCSGNVCPEPLFQLIPIIADDAPIEGPTEVCSEEIVSYSVTPYDGTDYNWTVSSFGTILEGQGTNTIRVAWSNVFTVNNMQWVEVEYENCWLECSGDSQLDVSILNEFYVSGAIEVCENSEETYTAFNVLPGPSLGWNFSLVDETGTTVWSDVSGTNTTMIEFLYGPGIFQLLATPVNPGDYCEDEYRLFLNVRPAPDAPVGIIGPDEICPGVVYTYEVDSPVGGADYRWYYNDGGNIGSIDGNPVALSWGNTPPYDLSLVRLSADGLNCESSAVQMTIQQIGTPVLTGPTDACREDVTQISATPFPGLDYQWSVIPSDAGTIISGQGSANVEVNWHAVGAVTVQLDLCGSTYDHLMTINDLPVPTVLAPSGLCEGETALTSTSIIYGAYEWYDEDGNLLSTTADPDLGPGLYEVVVTDAQGCIGNTTFEIEGYPLPDAFISTPDNTGYCAGDPIPTLYALDSEDGYTYQWYYEGLPIGGNSSSIVSIGYGDYYVEVTNIYGCVSTSNTVNLFEYCDIPGGICNGNCSGFPVGICDPGTDVTFSWVSDMDDCNTIFFTNTSVSFTPGTQEWNLGDGTITTDPAPVHTYANAGYYFTILTGLNAAGEFCWQSQPIEVPVAANFGFTVACAGEPMEFEDLSTFIPTSTIAVWNWDFGDPASGVQNVSFNENPTHIFDAPGFYDVTLVITDVNGCQSSIIQQVEVVAPPNADFLPPALDCEGTALFFQGNVSADVVEVLWDFDDPASGNANSSDQFDAYHQFNTPGSYDVSLTATSIYGCVTTFVETITVEPNPLAGDITASPSFELCEGETTTLNASPGGVAWEWSTGQSTESIQVSEGGAYSVTVTDANGCTFTPATQTVVVHPSPTNEIFAVEYDEYGQQVNYSFGNYTICEGEDVYLNVFEVPGQTYVWSNGETGIENIFAEWRGNELDAGTYDFTVDVTNSVTGCSAEIGPFQVVVNPVPADFTISADNNPPCAGEMTTISVDNPDPSLTYVWNTGQAATSITVSTAGEYFVTAFNASGCGTESAPVLILSGPDKTKIPSGCYTRCNPDTICLPNLLNVVDYQWYFNGSPIAAPEGTIADYIATESGTYYLEMTDIFGCTQTSDPLNLDLFDGFGDINGGVFLDVNENGFYDAGDTPMTGIDFNLLDLGGTIVGDATSDAGGAFSFVNILATQYVVELDTFSLPPNTTYQVFQLAAELVGCDDEENQIWLIIPSCPATTAILDVEVCEDESYDFNGTLIDPGDSQVFTLVNSAGCDSILTINVGGIPRDSTSLTFTACDSDPIFFDGVPLMGGTQTDFNYLNAGGCDSIITVIVDAASSSTTFVDLEVCPGESVEFNGSTYFEDTQEEFTFIDQFGCDSVVLLTVTAFSPVENMSHPEFWYYSVFLELVFFDWLGCEASV